MKKETKKRKPKRKKPKTMKTMDSSKGQSSGQSREPTVGAVRTVSELSEQELFDKYMIQLPKDDCTERDQWLKKKGYEVTDHSLGSGGFGKVFKAIRQGSNGSEEIAVKVIDLDPKAKKYKKRMNSLKNELYVSDALIRQINKVKHNHIITIFDRFIIESLDKDSDTKTSNAYFFMEMAEGDLAHELLRTGPLPDPLAKRYFAQIVYAIDYMHVLNIAHRDLKLENFLLVKSVTAPNQKDIKVTDFGLSRVHYKEDTGLILSGKSGGTPQYKAPEILRVQIGISRREYDVFKVDIWALGVCLYRMLTNRFPFPALPIPYSATDILKIVESQEKKSFVFRFSAQKIVINRMAKDLIRRLLDPEPDRRPKIYFVKSSKWLEGETTVTLSATPSAN